MLKTGDLRNNMLKLHSELRSIGFFSAFASTPQQQQQQQQPTSPPPTHGGQATHHHSKNSLDLMGISQGDPTAFLPVLHYILLDWNQTVARHFSQSRSVDLVARRDRAFLDAVYKLLRDEFAYRPCLSKDQFLSLGFAERKVGMLVDIVGLCKRLAEELRRTAANGASVCPRMGRALSVPGGGAARSLPPLPPMQQLQQLHQQKPQSSQGSPARGAMVPTSPAATGRALTSASARTPAVATMDAELPVAVGALTDADMSLLARSLKPRAGSPPRPATPPRKVVPMPIPAASAAAMSSPIRSAMRDGSSRSRSVSASPRRRARIVLDGEVDDDDDDYDSGEVGEVLVESWAAEEVSVGGGAASVLAGGRDADGMYVTRFEAAKRRWSGADGGNGATTTTTTTAAAKAGSRASSTERKSVQSMKEEELEDAVGARIRLEKENARLKLLVEALDLRVTHLERRTQSLEQKLLAFQTERETRRNESLSRVGDVNGDLKFHDASIIQTSSFLDGSAIDHELHLALLQQPPPTAVGSPPPRRWSLEKPPPKNDASPPSAATATARAYVPAGEFFETQASVNVMRRSSSGLGKPSTAAAAAAAPAPRDEGEKRGSQFRWTVGAEGVYATSVVGGEQRDGRVGGGPSGGELSETIRSLEERMRATAELLRSRARRIKGGGGIGGDLSVR